MKQAGEIFKNRISSLSYDLQETSKTKEKLESRLSKMTDKYAKLALNLKDETETNPVLKHHKCIYQNIQTD